ncbi:MAG: DUF2834 domain-containing protein [Chloroflexota bacterium]
MKVSKNVYLILAIVGTVIPWFFFGRFFMLNGFDVLLFLQSLFVNGAAGGFSADILISILVFWIWATVDARRHHVRLWWLIFPTGFTVGLSLAMPLYFYLRADHE